MRGQQKRDRTRYHHDVGGGGDVLERGDAVLGPGEAIIARLVALGLAGLLGLGVVRATAKVDTEGPGNGEEHDSRANEGSDTDAEFLLHCVLQSGTAPRMGMIWEQNRVSVCVYHTLNTTLETKG